MKYVKKLPHTDLSLKEKLEKDGWTKIKEPGNLPLAILFAYPLIIVLCGITLLFGYFLNPEIFCVFTENTLSMNIKFDMNMAVLLVAIFAYGLLHEFVHGALIPNVLKSDRTYWGFNGLFGFVYTHEPIKKGRFIIVSCMPFFCFLCWPYQWLLYLAFSMDILFCCF